MAAQTIKLSKTADIFTAIVRYKATFTDTIQSLQRSARAFPEDYCVLFVDVRRWDIMEDMMSFNVLNANFRATYVRYIGVGRIMMNTKVCFRFLKRSVRLI